MTDLLADIRAREAAEAAERWNRDHPPGTPVTYWPWSRADEPRLSRTRSLARVLGQTACVWVEGYGGGIALTHVEVRETGDGS